MVPVLNEADTIRDFLRRLRAGAPGAEIIVVDGGSEDATVALCRGLADHRLIQAPRGRASQMNAGARAASGETLWFLHADTLALPADGLGEIARALAQDPRLVGGCFRLRLPGRQWVYRISDDLGNVAADLFGFALGDHGIFCRRVAFLRAGGFPEVPLMEDAEFYRGLRRHGRMRQLPARITSSPRRYEQLGRYRTTFFYLLILALYVGGVRPEALAVVYRRLVRRKPRPPLAAARPAAGGGDDPARRWQLTPVR